MFFVDQYVWIDETGKAARDLERLWGRSLRGLRPEVPFEPTRGEDARRYSAIAAMAYDEVFPPFVVQGSVATEHFMAALEESVVSIVIGCSSGTGLSSLALGSSDSPDFNFKFSRYFY
jgi:hypothetical protein